MAMQLQIVFDCADPDKLAKFWAVATGYRLQSPPPGFSSWVEFLKANNVPESEWTSASAIVDPDGVGPRIYFQRVPESKSIKNRVHLDLNAGGGPSIPVKGRRTAIDAEVGRLVAHGATAASSFERGEEHHVVMKDVEGNEFCLH
ncbi:MAG: VOC family protein [Chloroflexota bacterium]